MSNSTPQQSFTELLNSVPPTTSQQTRSLTFTCVECSTTYPLSRHTHRISGHGLVCSDCYEENYCSCEDCGGDMHREDAHYIEDHGDLCEGCYRLRLIRDAVIRPAAYKPRFNFYKLAWENTNYLGIELEVEIRGDRVAAAKRFMQWIKDNGYQDMVYLKEDGSLEDGFEVVFHPITLAALHKKVAIKKILAFLNTIGATSFKSGRCGLHVHISKEGLTGQDLCKGKLFFYRCQDYLKRFSMRGQGSDLDDDDIFNYCHFEHSKPHRHDPYVQRHGRYSAFNTCASTDTAEIRIFRGTLGYTRFMASIQFADCFYHYIKEVSIAHIDANHKAVVWQSFIDFAKRTNRYQIMTNYLLKHRII